jgi:hypothetical protein
MRQMISQTNNAVGRDSAVSANIDDDMENAEMEQNTEEMQTPKLPYTAVLWRALRRPFTLNPQMRHVHKCQWERIDMGVLGCSVCSTIHVCSIDTCPTTQSQDATVCLLSGVCLTSNNFVQEEYSDRVAPYIFCTSNRSERRSVTLDQIREMTTHLILSNDAKMAFDVEVRRRAQRMSNRMGLLIEKSVASVHPAPPAVNAIKLLEETQADFTSQNKLMCCYNVELRKIVIENVITSVSHIINTWQWQWLKNIKPMELRMYVVGLMYLMRSGISIYNIQVVPCIPHLVHLLPTENLLETIFDYKSKHITDIENKFKFYFRQMSHETLLKLGLHTQV